ncbi:MAG: hypothetical protein R3C59_22165 [Planctomycetaceae bacterium]
MDLRNAPEIGHLLRWAVCLVIAANAHAAHQKSDDAADAVQRHWLKESRAVAESFLVLSVPGGDDTTAFQLSKQPIFRHTQSVRGDDIGAVHLWVTQDQRPVAVGAVFAWSLSATARMVSYEFHSLSQEPLQLMHSGAARWTCPQPGFEWKFFDADAAPPGPTPLKQRLQVRQLARLFTASTTTQENQRWELRFVPTPIYQYGGAGGDVSYGAMFAFCQGTDTEVIVVIEAVTDHTGGQTAAAKWRYALVPFTDYKARVRLSDKEIWESPDGAMNEDGKPHFWSMLGPRPKPDFEQQP